MKDKLVKKGIMIKTASFWGMGVRWVWGLGGDCKLIEYLKIKIKTKWADSGILPFCVCVCVDCSLKDYSTRKEIDFAKIY